jgi:putative endonuclease
MDGDELLDLFYHQAPPGHSLYRHFLMKTGYVYIMSSKSRRLYIGVTSNLEGRVWEHKEGRIEGFTKTYKINQLVYYEDYPDLLSAIAREKQLKGWSRARKIELILKRNSKWEELGLR